MADPNDPLKPPVVPDTPDKDGTAPPVSPTPPSDVEPPEANPYD